MSQDRDTSAPQYADDDLLHEDDDLIAPDRPKRTREWGTPWAVLLVCLLIGVVAGVIIVGKGATSTSDAGGVATSAPPAAAPSVDPQLRIGQLQAQVSADPSDVDARLELGVLLWSLDTPDLDGARDQWLAVTQLDPSNANAWYDLGFYYLALDPPDMTAAKAAWDKVIALDPNGDLAAQVEDHMAGLFPDSATPAPDASPSASQGG